jgi:flagellar biogenesis protein FliO
MISTTFTVATVSATHESKLFEALVGLLPLVIFLLILFFILRRLQNSPAAKLQSKYLQQQMELMPRIEALLERVAKALERNQ